MPAQVVSRRKAASADLPRGFPTQRFRTPRPGIRDRCRDNSSPPRRLGTGRSILPEGRRRVILGNRPPVPCELAAGGIGRPVFPGGPTSACLSAVHSSTIGNCRSWFGGQAIGVKSSGQQGRRISRICCFCYSVIWSRANLYIAARTCRFASAAFSGLSGALRVSLALSSMARDSRCRMALGRLYLDWRLSLRLSAKVCS